MNSDLLPVFLRAQCLLWQRPLEEDPTCPKSFLFLFLVSMSPFLRRQEALGLRTSVLLLAYKRLYSFGQLRVAETHLHLAPGRRGLLGSHTRGQVELAKARTRPQASCSLVSPRLAFRVSVLPHTMFTPSTPDVHLTAAASMGQLSFVVRQFCSPGKVLIGLR